jgi:hypothetical protein
MNTMAELTFVVYVGTVVDDTDIPEAGICGDYCIRQDLVADAMAYRGCNYCRWMCQRW